MPKRIIEISKDGCYLRLKHQQLIIEQNKETLGSIPIEDMSALIIDNPQTIISQSVLSKLVSNNVMVVSTDENHLPIGLFLPLSSHTTQTERFAEQINLSKPIKKNLWKQIIRSKVLLQAKVLNDLTDNDGGIRLLAKKIRSGDPDNIEAQAARRYWNRLFEDKTFRRDRTAEDQNRFLNYGYAILRALFARSLVACGLHPSLGLHHHNRYNAYCLADDMMEPYRPLVDLHVWSITQELAVDSEMDRELKSRLLEIVKTQVQLENETYTFQGAIQKSSQSLARVILDEGKTLILPS